MSFTPSVPLELRREARAHVDGIQGAAADESALIERAKDDRGAFAELYRAHYAAVGRYLYRRCGDAHATEDMLADTFLSALRGIARFRAGSVPFRHWLLRIATNVANKRVRKLRVRAEEQTDVVERATGASSEPHATELDPALIRALLGLAPKHQAVLSLVYVEGLSVDETAAVLRCRPGTVKSRLSRARAALAQRLARKP